MSPLTTETRPIAIQTPLGEETFVVERMTGVERMSELFQFTLDVLTDLDTSCDPARLLGKPASIHLRLADGNERVIHGITSRFAQGDRGTASASYRLEVVPTLWRLTLSARSRIFQQMSVPDIVEKVFGEMGVDYETSTTQPHPVREYCVQYRETDFAFISRLLEEEGIFYFFRHTADKDTVVLADAPSAIQPCEVHATLDFAPSGMDVRPENVVETLSSEHVLTTRQVTLADWNWLTPATQLRNTLGDGAERYDYPGKYGEKDDGDRLARLRLEVEEAPGRTVRGTTPCPTVQSGFRVALQHHPEVRGDYLITAVEHRAMGSPNLGASGSGGAFTYDNSFTAIPHEVPFRPPLLTPKPRVYGTQTATVVGPGGEEIYTDKYGRVKVQFFWDREGKKNEGSSCWVRVASLLAGKGWGWVNIPRIGQEVVVDFLEGDPDRPIIIGRVYNAEQMPPYTLPANMTQSGIKTRSSKGGGSSEANELRFEDKKGSEEIYLHAQKDLNAKIEHDETRDVLNNRTTKIKQNDDHTVSDGNHTITVGRGNQTISINGNQDVTIKTGNQTVKIDAGKQGTEALQSIELKVGQNSILIDQTGVTIKGMMVKIEGQIQTQVKAPMTQVNGDGMLTLKGGLTMIN